MEFLKNPYFVLAIIACCTVIIYLANTKSMFGKFINGIFPCTQNPENSFPCYGGYDLLVMFIAGVVGCIFIGILLFDIYQNFKS